MQRKHPLASIAVAVALVGAAPLALAQTNPAQSGHPKSGAVTHTPPFQSPSQQDLDQEQNRNPDQTSMSPRTSRDHRVMGKHDVTGTVESVSTGGVVEVRTDEGLLKVHFPHARQNLKKGEKITLHLGYTVDEPATPSSM